jgi:hypothetical protein
MKPNNEKELAEKHSCSVRTIRRWKAEGAPLGDEPQMALWLASRKHVPKATATQQRVKASPAPPKRGKGEAGTQGAASALRRLEAEELKAYESLQVALESGDPIAIRFAREHWVRISESLRKFDLLVEQNRRDSGEMISRKLCEDLLEQLTYLVRINFKIGISGLAWRVSMMDDAVSIQELLNQFAQEGVFNSITVMAANWDLITKNQWAIRALLRGTQWIGGEEKTVKLFDARYKGVAATFKFSHAMQAWYEKREGPMPDPVAFLLAEYPEFADAETEAKEELEGNLPSI